MSKHATTFDSLSGFEWYTERGRVCVRFEGDVPYSNGIVRRRPWCEHFDYSTTAHRNLRTGRHSTDDRHYQYQLVKRALVVLLLGSEKYVPWESRISTAPTLYMWVTPEERTDVLERWRDRLAYS